MDSKALLRELGLRPFKKLGQNFLVDARVLERILAAAEIQLQDTVLEIGAGLGILTQALAKHAQRVVAVEVDQRLVTILHEQLGTLPNTEIVQGDILELDIPTLLQDKRTGSVPPYKVVANIPYYITSALLRRLLEARCRPLLIVLMVQKEVAQRIVAQPSQMSLLAVSVQFYGKPCIVTHVPACAFYPVPKVDSAIVRIEPHERLPLPDEDIAPFFDLVRAGFAQRRKQLHNALIHGLPLPAERITPSLVKAGIDGRRRAETLQLAEWVTLYHAIRSTADIMPSRTL
jgi:16S rRNA (adenine1518-N6/adenine1519-N6)-dimethyltransferase